MGSGMKIVKSQVFLVSGRAGGDGPRGPVVDCVVCSPDEGSVLLCLGQAAPEFSVVSVTSLETLELAVANVKAAITGQSQAMPVVVDPALSAMAAA